MNHLGVRDLSRKTDGFAHHDWGPNHASRLVHGTFSCGSGWLVVWSWDLEGEEGGGWVTDGRVVDAKLFCRRYQGSSSELGS